jgi:hypothetical protein
MAIPPKMKGGTGFTLRVLVDTDSSFAYKQNRKVNSSSTQNIHVYGLFALIYYILFLE